jgi:hypothetical protein
MALHGLWSTWRDISCMGGVTMPKNIFIFFINFALTENCAIGDSILGIYAHALEH